MSDQTNEKAISPGWMKGQSGGNEVQPGSEVLTRAELDKLLLEAENRAVSRAQSFFDKAGSTVLQQQVKGRMDEVERGLQAAGMEITPEQKAAIQQRIINETLIGSNVKQDQPPPTLLAPKVPSPGPEQEQLDPAYSAAWSIMQEAGVIINDDDPEVRLIDHSSPAKLLTSVQAAITEKSKRMPPPRTPTNAGGLGGHNLSLEQQYKNELSKVAGNAQAVTAVKIKYRNLGLPVY